MFLVWCCKVNTFFLNGEISTLKSACGAHDAAYTSRAVCVMFLTWCLKYDAHGV